jgi:hypothetical protein
MAGAWQDHQPLGLAGTLIEALRQAQRNHLILEALPGVFGAGLFPILAGVTVPSGFALADAELLAPPRGAVLAFVAMTRPGTLDVLALASLER